MGGLNVVLLFAFQFVSIRIKINLNFPNHRDQRTDSPCQDCLTPLILDLLSAKMREKERKNVTLSSPQAAMPEVTDPILGVMSSR